MGEQYRYDQLNRLTSSSTTRFALGGGSPTATQDYATAYSYDPNGNLRTLSRNGNASVGGQPLAMDQLSYSYDTAHDQDNRLLRVNDAVPDAYADDIKYNQSTANQYVYDAIGNLTSDNTGGVTKTITWNVYGKISQVQQSNGVLVRYGYDAQGNRIRKSFSSDNGTNWRHVYYVRDATGNVLAVYEQTESPRYPRRLTDSPTILGTITLTEQPLYGSSRLGERQLSLALNSGAAATDSYQRVVGQKRYELTDHLGNVRALVSDTKLTDVAGTFKPDLKAYYNYYPFGMLQPNRNGPGTRSLAGGYRYGYNGKEMDNNGELGLTSYDYGARIYNPGLGRFLSADPLAFKYPHFSPYHALANNPILFVDPNGGENIVYVYISNTAKAAMPKLSGADIKRQTESLLEIHGFRNIKVMIVSAPIKAELLDGNDTFVAITGAKSNRNVNGYKYDSADELDKIVEQTSTSKEVGTGRYKQEGDFVFFGPKETEHATGNTVYGIFDKNERETVNPGTPDMIGIKADYAKADANEYKFSESDATIIATIIVHGVIHNGGLPHSKIDTGKNLGNDADAGTIGSGEGLRQVMAHKYNMTDKQRKFIRQQFPASGVPTDNRARNAQKVKSKQ